MPDYYRRVKSSMQALGKERFAQLDDLLDAVQLGIKAFD
jgi:hypothetical protein